MAGLAALVLGLAAGIGVTAARWDLLNGMAAVIEPLGALWVNAIRMVLVPLVVALLVTSVTSFSDTRALGRLGARTVTIFLLLLAGAAIVTALVAPPLFEHMTMSSETSAALRAQMQTSPETPTPELPSLRGFMVGLVPTNPIRAAADGAMLPLIVFTLLFALATTRLPEEGRRLVTGFFRAVGQAMLLVVGWILRLTPIGVFALALGMGKELGLAVSTFKLNTPVSDLIGPLFLAQLYGIDLTTTQIVVMTFVTIAMSFSNPGIPSGGLFVVTAPVMLSAGLPLEGIGLLIAADAIPDVFATVVNVTGDMGVAAMVADTTPLADPQG